MAQERSEEAEAWRREVQDLLKGEKKIAAIKLYRERTGVGLAEAKAAVEALERMETPLAQPVDADLESPLLELLRAKGKLEAIRYYRAQTGCDLKTAKDAVEELARRHGIASQGGCAGMLLLFAFICGAAALAAWR